MFTVDASITDLKMKENVIAKILFSMNSPQVATPELSTEEARCYIVVFREGSAYRMSIGLFLPNSGRRFYYTYSENPFAEARMNEALDEASRFAEEMGFLLDELKLTTMSMDERNQWIDSQQIFSAKPPEPTKEESSEEPREEQKPAEAAQERTLESTAEKLRESFSESLASQTAEQTATSAPAATPPQVAEQPAVPTPKQPSPAAEQKIVSAVTPPPPAAAQSSLATEQKIAAPPPDEQAAQVEQPPREPAKKTAPEPQEEPVEQAPAPAAHPERRQTARTKAAPQAVVAQQKEEEDAAPEAQKPKPRMKKVARAATGTVSREHEALARLLASF